MRYLAGVVFCGALAAASIAFAADQTAPDDGGWNLETLMAGLRQIPSASAHFVELKTIHMLTRPIQAAGTLRYVAPDMLEKITTMPAPESIRLEGDRLTGMRGDGDSYSVDVSGHSEIAAMVEGIRSTLAGDLPTLQKYYLIAFSGEHDRWQMELVPRNRRVREKVDRIRIAGGGTVITTISVDEKDGDRSEMTITPDTPAPARP